jgi:hypothetical protein
MNVNTTGADDVSGRRPLLHPRTVASLLTVSSLCGWTLRGLLLAIAAGRCCRKGLCRRNAIPARQVN